MRPQPIAALLLSAVMLPAPVPAARAAEFPPVAVAPIPFRAGSRALEVPRGAGTRTLAQGDEKKQVPKPPESPPPRHKPEEPTSVTTEDDEGSSCFADCASGFFSSLFTSRETPAPPAPAAALVPLDWAIGERGWLVSAAPEDSVALWEHGGDSAYEPAVIARLARNTQVVVVETHGSATGRWLRVRPADAPAPLGWIEESHMSRAPPAPSPVPRPPRGMDRWRIKVAAGPGLCGPSDLNVEYKDGGFRAEVELLRRVRQWNGGVAVGFRNFEGHPRFNYVTPTTVEEPSESSLEMLDIGLRFGQWYGSSGAGPRFAWTLGPSLVRVYEEAHVRVLDGVTL